MEKMTVSAKVPANEKKGIKEMAAEVYVDAPQTAEEGVKMFGPQAMLSNALGNWKITLQAGIRRGLLAGKTAQQLQAEFASAKMGVATQAAKVDPIQASLAVFKTMTKEERAKYLADLKAAAIEA